MNRVPVARRSPQAGLSALASRYTVTFDGSLDPTFGPWGYDETCRDLTVPAALEPVEARALVLDAWTHGIATRDAGGVA